MFVISVLQHVELALPSCWSHPRQSTIISPLVRFYDAGQFFCRCAAALFNGQSLDVATWWIAAAVVICVVKCGPLCLIGYWGKMKKQTKKWRRDTRVQCRILYQSKLIRCFLTGSMEPIQVKTSNVSLLENWHIFVFCTCYLLFVLGLDTGCSASDVYHNG